MIVTAHTSIKAPIAEVFALFTDFNNLQRNVSAITKIEFLQGDGEAKVGMKWRETRVMFGKEATEEMWITGIEQDKSYTVESESHGTKYHSVYTFTDEGDGATDVTMKFRGTPLTFTAKLMSLLFVAFKGAAVKALQKDMDDLKKILEQSHQ